MTWSLRALCNLMEAMHNEFDKVPASEWPKSERWRRMVVVREYLFKRINRECK